MALTQYKICFSKIDFIAKSEQNKYIIHSSATIRFAIFGCPRAFRRAAARMIVTPSPAPICPTIMPAVNRECKGYRP
jgi:hypothetical protein